MESITKNRQPVAVLREMVARGYGADQVPAGEGWFSELGHGWFNAAYRIRLRDGSEVVLKIAPPASVEVLAYERGAMATELAALRLILSACHATVIPSQLALSFASEAYDDMDRLKQPADAETMAALVRQLVDVSQSMM